MTHPEATPDTRSQRRPFLVGVAGGSGSGKTTICRKLIEQLGESATLLSSDHYYHDQSHLSQLERDQLNFDHPDAIDFSLLSTHLAALRLGQSISVPQYSFESHTRIEQTERLVPPSMVFVEGILLFVDPDIRRQFDLRIFVDAEPEIRLQRRVKRDQAERGRTEASVRQQWDAWVSPMYLEHVAPTQATSHLTIHTDTDSDVSVDLIATALAHQLQKR